MTASMISNAGHSGELYCPTCEAQYATGDRCPDDGTKLVRLATTVDPFLGRELEGRYTIIEKLGQGGMGTVYRGHQHSVGRDVAIKVVTPSLVSSPDVIKRFLRECKLASRLSHPNAVGVLDFGQTDDGVFFLVMEMVAGRTLSDVMDSERVLKPERVIRIGIQICDALEGAHGMSVVHRDLKPSNVMLLSAGRDLVKVLDFGLAKSLSPDSTQSTMTGTGALMGTPAYMPPELATGQECDGRADLYSLGCVLYYLGTGDLPFSSDSVHELVVMHANDPAPPMAGVPPALAAVVARLLLKDPVDRFQSATETREALEWAQAHLHDPKAVPPHVLNGDTSISLGPFPATASQFDFLKSAPGVKALDDKQLGVLDTFAAPLSIAPRPSRRSRRLVLASAIVAATVIAIVIVVALTRRGDEPVQRAPVTGSGVAIDAGAAAAVVPPVDAGVAASAAPIDAGIDAAASKPPGGRPGGPRPRPGSGSGSSIPAGGGPGSGRPGSGSGSAPGSGTGSGPGSAEKPPF